MELNFCRRCGKPLQQTSRTTYQCTDGHTTFTLPTPATGIFFVTEQNEVILSVRGREPRKGMLDSFGGFIEVGETIEAAAKRELLEETSLTPDDYEELHFLTTATGTYPYQGEPVPTLVTFYWTKLKPGHEIHPADDVASSVTIPLHEVDPTRLHDDDVRAGIAALQKLFPKNS